MVSVGLQCFLLNYGLSWAKRSYSVMAPFLDKACIPPTAGRHLRPLPVSVLTLKCHLPVQQGHDSEFFHPRLLFFSRTLCKWNCNRHSVLSDVSQFLRHSQIVPSFLLLGIISFTIVTVHFAIAIH